MLASPAVSVIISAYNRPKIIPFAIRSVLQSSFEDLELIVVGDGCNPETEAAIRSFTDPRVKFFNLPANTGHQSSPHNEGMAAARGKYLFLLNQDDMYFADHIKRRVEFMESGGAEISWCSVILFQSSGCGSDVLNADQDRFTLDGVSSDNLYSPRTFIISSSWALRRDVVNKVGQWLEPRQTLLSPSQEWLFRAHRKGCRIAYHPHPSVLCIHSGVRRYSYVSPNSPEHERAWRWVAGGDECRVEILNALATQTSVELVRVRRGLAIHQRTIRPRAERILALLGVHPDAFNRWRAGLKKGTWVQNHKRFTSAPPSLLKGHRVDFGNVEADEFAGKGWHLPERGGRWSSGETAELFFTVSEAEKTNEDLRLHICGHPLRLGDRVTFSLSDGTVVAQELNATNDATVLPIRSSGTFCLSISVKAPQSPETLNMNPDPRILGYWLSSICMQSTDPNSAEAEA